MEKKIVLNRKSVGLIHKVYVLQLKNRKRYTASTKTKSEVRGGGKKPWRQKGTGQARAGSSRSPLWRGGGVIFGPKPRIVQKKINKKERRLAILSALYLKKKHIQFVDDSFFSSFDQCKTKEIVKLLAKQNIDLSKKILIITSKINKNLWRATRNLKNLVVSPYNCVSLESLLRSKIILISKENLENINLKYGKAYYEKK